MHRIFFFAFKVGGLPIGLDPRTLSSDGSVVRCLANILTYPNFGKINFEIKPIKRNKWDVVATLRGRLSSVAGSAGTEISRAACA